MIQSTITQRRCADALSYKQLKDWIRWILVMFVKSRQYPEGLIWVQLGQVLSSVISWRADLGKVVMFCQDNSRDIHPKGLICMKFGLALSAVISWKANLSDVWSRYLTSYPERLIKVKWVKSGHALSRVISQRYFGWSLVMFCLVSYYTGLIWEPYIWSCFVKCHILKGYLFEVCTYFV